MAEQELLIKNRHIELGAVVVNNCICLFDQFMNPFDHVDSFRFLNRVEHDAAMVLPLRGPTERVSLLNNVVGIDVLFPEAPSVHFVWSRLYVEEQYFQMTHPLVVDKLANPTSRQLLRCYILFGTLFGIPLLLQGTQ